MHDAITHRDPLRAPDGQSAEVIEVGRGDEDLGRELRQHTHQPLGTRAIELGGEIVEQEDRRIAPIAGSHELRQLEGEHHRSDLASRAKAPHGLTIEQDVDVIALWTGQAHATTKLVITIPCKDPSPRLDEIVGRREARGAVAQRDSSAIIARDRRVDSTDARLELFEQLDPPSHQARGMLR